MLGLPALASDLGAYAERLGAGGRSFPRGDAGALARELDALVEDPARLAAMRAAVRPPAPFEEHFGRVLALYEEVLGEERRPLEDRFDVGRHLELLQLRYDARERHALGRTGTEPGSSPTDPAAGGG